MIPNAFDFLIVAILLFFIGRNAALGMRDDLLGFPGGVVSFILGLKLMTFVGGKMMKFLPIPKYLAYAMALIFSIIAVSLFIKFVVETADKTINPEVLTMAYKIGGGIIGFIKGAFLTSVILILIALLPFGSKFETAKERSKLLSPMLRFGPAAVHAVSRFAPDAANLLNNMVTDLENWGKPKAPSTQDSTPNQSN